MRESEYSEYSGPDTLTGRHAALTEVDALLRRTRLVTVTGPGGVGKSALAGALARRSALVPEAVVGRTDLTALDGPELLPHWLARALRRDGHPGKPQLAALAESLGDGLALLVVDTCERLAGPCTEIFAELVDACPGLHVLATSRIPLETPGRYPLPPVPPEVAAGLFTAYARQLGARGETAPGTVRRICALLDGLPLAVLIAAGRLAHSPADDVLSCFARAENILDLPATVPGLPGRHRTLRDSLSWSRRLCTADERLLWARCSVFPGGFELAHVLEVCGDGLLPAGPLAGALTGLSRQSLIEPVPETGGTAFRMPRATRAYGRQQLGRSGEEREFVNRFLTWSLRHS
ncbi:ATP-binding protein [Streptomyces sclerotialus]|uniref:ATP-binding protein n=1 Tax=Streptomyces sclerotialus TaxID=1957 RepID=UPI00068D7BB4